MSTWRAAPQGSSCHTALVTGSETTHLPVGRTSDAVDRRDVLKLAAGGLLGVGALGVPSLGAAAAALGTGGGPVTMAMHIHGSFSEGTASMDAHLQQARRLGVDVVWWTDHDFRVAALGYRRAVGFDGEQEYENGLAWTWVPYTSGNPQTAAHEFVATPHSPGEAGGALRVRVTGPVDGSAATYLLEGEAWNFTYTTSYVDTVLELDVLPERVGDSAHVLVEIGSSYRPATGGRPAGQYRLQYRIGAAAGYRRADSGRLGIVGVPVTGTGWQRVRMDLRADHAKLWPDTVAGDASVKQFRVGVRASHGATAQGVVDRLRFLRDRQTAADGMALLRGLVRAYRARYPAITQYAASEISLVEHLNSFGGDGTLPTYDTTVPVKDPSVQAQRVMVRFLHGHGAVVSINHPTPGTALAHRLVTTNGLGADIIEVGTSRQVEVLAKAFDVAARNAVFITASGVSDDHFGNDWLTPVAQRWITGAWADSRGSGALCAAMAAGRAWFFDPLWWRGELDLLVDGRVPMGGVLLTRHRTVPVRVTATALPRNGSLELVVGRCDRAGTDDLRPANQSTTVPASSVVRGRWSTEVTRGGGVYIRAMVRSHDGTVVGFSNPVWVLPARLEGQVAVPRDRRYT